MNTLGVSVVICCYNSATRLPETIRFIANQKVSHHIPWEFIIVDNASTDDTASLSAALWNSLRSDIPFRVVHEPLPGLSYARHAGFTVAQFEYVVMCDDDNWLNDLYVQSVYEIMQHLPKVAVLGGRGVLQYEITAEEWVKRTTIFASGPQAHQSGIVKQGKVYGAGMTVRKSAYLHLIQCGFKSLLTDRKGAALSSGGDYELCYACVLAGYQIWYDERLHFTHFITRERLTWSYFVKYINESVKCFDVLGSYKFIAMHNATNFYMMSLREFIYNGRQLLFVNMKRLFTGNNTTTGKVLYLRHLEFRYKVVNFISSFQLSKKAFREVLVLKKKLEAKKPEVLL